MELINKLLLGTITLTILGTPLLIWFWRDWKRHGTKQKDFSLKVCAAITNMIVGWWGLTVITFYGW